MMAVLGISLMMVFVYQDWFGLLAGLVVWSIGAYVLRLVAHNDEQMRQVYRRSLRYKTYMPAQAHHDAPYPETLGKK
jgi:type IV secretory pathway TrbD component